MLHYQQEGNRAAAVAVAKMPRLICIQGCSPWQADGSVGAVAAGGPASGVFCSCGGSSCTNITELPNGLDGLLPKGTVTFFPCLRVGFPFIHHDGRLGIQVSVELFKNHRQAKRRQAVKDRLGMRPVSNRTCSTAGPFAKAVAIVLGAVGVLASRMTLPSQSMTQTSVSSTETSNPAEYLMAALLFTSELGT